MVFISQKLDQFAYFAAQLERHDWRGLDVLDFGGNIGNLLRDPTARLDESRYWCLDVDAEAAAQASERNPSAHWLTYDRFCFHFNPRGLPGLALPNLGQSFDIICAYSVFTNTSRADMLDLVGQLRAWLRAGGVLAFTFIDPHHRAWPDSYLGTNLRWRLERSRQFGHTVDVEAVLSEAGDAPWLTLVNHDRLLVGHEDLGPEPIPPDQQLAYSGFYTVEAMQAVFPDARVRAPVNGEMQHCCILGPAQPSSR